MSGLVFKLFNGEVGKVVEGSNWDEERDCIVVDEKEYELGEYENGIEEWIEEMNVDVDKIVLFRDYGYRGKGCYSWFYKNEKGECFSLDIINDFYVYGVEEKS